MKQRSGNRKYRKMFFRCQNGQAMTEYLFIVVMIGLVCIPIVKWLPDAVRGYVQPFYYCLSRPIP